jgi:hypothetical protein
MQEGFLPDFGDGAIARPGVWARGRPAKGWLVGLFGQRMRRSEQVPITAYRCSACGYVEIYAKPAGET